MANVVRGAAPGNVLFLGSWAGAVLRAAVEGRAGCVDAWEGGVGAVEAARSGEPTAVAAAPASGLCALPAEAPAVTGELWLAPGVPPANGTGEGVVTLSGVFLKVLLAVSPGVLFETKSPCVRLRATVPGSWDATRLSDKGKEEMQASTRAIHILWVCWEQGWVPEAPSQPLSGC